MIHWTPYPKAPGAYATVGEVILEAYQNGSWVVRHRLKPLYRKQSSLVPLLNPKADLNTAKEAAEKALNELLERE